AFGEWFETLGMKESPFMLYTHKALRPDETAAVTHLDGTSRVQTVSAEQNPYLYRILDAFERQTGVPVLINTSFNLRGEPIVASWLSSGAIPWSSAPVAAGRVSSTGSRRGINFSMAVWRATPTPTFFGGRASSTAAIPWRSIC